MDKPPSGNETRNTSGAPDDEGKKNPRTATRTPSIIVGIVAAVVAALSVFYLLRPEPLLVCQALPRAALTPALPPAAPNRVPSDPRLFRPRAILLFPAQERSA